MKNKEVTMRLLSQGICRLRFRLLTRTNLKVLDLLQYWHYVPQPGLHVNIMYHTVLAVQVPPFCKRRTDPIVIESLQWHTKDLGKREQTFDQFFRNHRNPVIKWNESIRSQLAVAPTSTIRWRSKWQMETDHRQRWLTTSTRLTGPAWG